MTLEEKLIDYFARRGVNLKEKNAKYIVELILSEGRDKVCVVTRFHYNVQKNEYEKMRTMYVPYEMVLRYYAKRVKPVKYFWKYIVVAPDGEPLEDIYSLNPGLFD